MGQGHNDENEWIGDYIDSDKIMPYFDQYHRYCWFDTDEDGLKA